MRNLRKRKFHESRELKKEGGTTYVNTKTTSKISTLLTFF